MHQSGHIRPRSDPTGKPMTKIVSAIFTTIALALGGVAISSGAATAAPVSYVAPAAGVAPTLASCFKNPTVYGAPAVTYGKFSSLNNWSRYATTQVKMTACINYSKAQGGYYFYTAVCSNSQKAIQSNMSLRAAKNMVATSSTLTIGCWTSSTWKWKRLVANDQCADVQAKTFWTINRSTGALTVRNFPVDGYLVPKNC